MLLLGILAQSGHVDTSPLKFVAGVVVDDGAGDLGLEWACWSLLVVVCWVPVRNCCWGFWPDVGLLLVASAECLLKVLAEVFAGVELEMFVLFVWASLTGAFVSEHIWSGIL